MLPVKLRHHVLRVQEVRRRRSRHCLGQNVPPAVLQMRLLRQNLPDRRARHVHRQKLPLHQLRQVGCDKQPNGDPAAGQRTGVAPPRHDTSDPVQKVSTASQKGTTAENKKVVSGQTTNEKCAGCSEELKEGQALMALDKQVSRCFWPLAVV